MHIDQTLSIDLIFLESSIRMENKGLCTESIRAIQRYFASLPFDQGVHAHQSGLQPKFSGLCTRTNQSHLAVFSIDRNTIGCYDIVRIYDSSNSFKNCCQKLNTTAIFNKILPFKPKRLDASGLARRAWQQGCLTFLLDQLAHLTKQNMNQQFYHTR